MPRAYMVFYQRIMCSRLGNAFRKTSTPIYMSLIFGRMIILIFLINNKDVKLKLPSLQEFHVYTAISEKYSVLEHVWGAVDGLKLKVQELGNFYI